MKRSNKLHLSFVFFVSFVVTIPVSLRGVPLRET